MARPLTLLLVRHGQSEWNARGLMQGQTAHVPLTELGHAQAAAAAAELAAPRPGRADLQRPAPRPADRRALRAGDRPAGHHDAGAARAGLRRARGPAVPRLWDVVDWTDPHWSAEGGESLAELHGRVEAYLKELCAEPPADVVALVTHGDTIRAAQAVAAGLGPERCPRSPRTTARSPGWSSRR